MKIIISKFKEGHCQSVLKYCEDVVIKCAWSFQGMAAYLSCPKHAH